MRTFDGVGGSVEIVALGGGVYRLVVDARSAQFRLDLSHRGLLGLIGEGLDQIVAEIRERETCTECEAGSGQDHRRDCEIIEMLVGGLRELRLGRGSKSDDEGD